MHGEEKKMTFPLPQNRQQPTATTLPLAKKLSSSPPTNVTPLKYLSEKKV
jgi:hypothetical protein